MGGVPFGWTGIGEEHAGEAWPRPYTSGMPNICRGGAMPRPLFADLFVAEKIRLVRETSWIFRTLVDVPPAHAGLLRKRSVWFVRQAGFSVPWSMCRRRMPVCLGLLLRPPEFKQRPQARLGGVPFGWTGIGEEHAGEAWPRPYTSGMPNICRGGAMPRPLFADLSLTSSPQLLRLFYKWRLPSPFHARCSADTPAHSGPQSCRGSIRCCIQFPQNRPASRPSS